MPIRNLSMVFAVALAAGALTVNRASAAPTLFGGGVERGDSGIVLVDDPITWIRGKSCPYGLDVVARRYNRRLRTWQVKCSS